MAIGLRKATLQGSSPPLPPEPAGVPTPTFNDVVEHNVFEETPERTKQEKSNARKKDNKKAKKQVEAACLREKN
jgi:hypothetical protein